MAELNICSLFGTLCGSDKILNKNDVQDGRLDENIAKALGIIDENCNYTEESYTFEQMESINIDKLLADVHLQSSMIKAGQSGDDNSTILEIFKKFNKKKAENKNEEARENQGKKTNNSTKTKRSHKGKYKQPKTYLRVDQTKEQKIFDDANNLLVDFANGKKQPKKVQGVDKNGVKVKQAIYKGQWIDVLYDENNQIKEIRISHKKNCGPDGDIAEVVYTKDKAYYNFNDGGHYEGSIESWQFEWEKLKNIVNAIFR